MKQWQRIAHEPHRATTSRQNAMQETREKLTSMNVKIGGSADVAGITLNTASRTPIAFVRSRDSAHEQNTRRTTLSRTLWQRKNFYGKRNATARSRESADVLGESRWLIRLAICRHARRRTRIVQMPSLLLRRSLTTCGFAFPPDDFIT